MKGEALTLGIAMVLMVVGLLALLYGEYAGLTTTFVPGGGIVVLVGVGILTAHIARVPRPEGAESEH
ncbi:hypothetical protein [Halogeometricum limi]|uniref:Uncharacterized protein n=1 Tax=Halogeometricum limi TaxID=555875 RepID=A0A1I6IRY5_9EURY|nr:hypothetical protein [Halogeometricum limi]SFR69000.1 hypothetical protein SAMN04488124_3514 [Halogeometricum limi]